MSKQAEPALAAILGKMDRPVIAVSGGVDSLTLSAFAQGVAPDCEMLHAVSPAVPQSATERVKKLAAGRGWRLRLIDAGEFSDPRYLANPSNRCFFCKTNLYGMMA
ncbi:MAG: adenine nucleotide alpha hydrolase, partial [Hyphomicrobiales bacterium]|nr:adenine nucleotide alpha hydrolase [Hyphomicrobiales bacterium]